jgi:hypothetical protein
MLILILCGKGPSAKQSEEEKDGQLEKGKKKIAY